jgi:hypothetical protein
VAAIVEPKCAYRFGYICRTGLQASNCQQVCSTMYNFLQEVGIASHLARSLIIGSLAGKVNVLTPGWYDPESW